MTEVSSRKRSFTQEGPRRGFSSNGEQRDPPPATLVFIHIPKTGGSTLCNVLSRQYRDRQQYWIRPDTHRKTAGEALRGLDEERRRSLRLVTGHVPYGLHDSLRPNEVQYMTLLRDPVSRLRSLYLFARERPRNQLHDVARDGTLESFARTENTAQLDNDQTRFLAGDLAVGAEPLDRPVTEVDFDRACRHLTECRAVGVTERFDESLLAMSKLFGWRLPLYSAQKVSRESVVVTDEARDAILARNQFDRALYELAVDMFHALLRGTSMTPGKVGRFRVANRIAQPAATVYRRVRWR